MRGFTRIQAFLTICLILMMGVVWGLPIAPALYVFDFLNAYGANDRGWLDLAITGFSASIAFLVWGFFLLLLSGFLQFIVHLRFEDKIEAPLASLTTIRWAICGQLHRSTHPFLAHVVPSFIANGYYRLAGCKIGKNVNINTIALNDPSLVEIGDNVVIGGGATINGHLVERNTIVLEKVTIGHSALVGGGSMVGPGSRIGTHSVLASRAVLPKRKIVPDNQTWGGIPARFIYENQDSSK